MDKDEIEFLLYTAEIAEDHEKMFSLACFLLEGTSEKLSQNTVRSISLGIKKKMSILRMAYKTMQNVESDNQNLYENRYFYIFQEYKNKIKNEYYEACTGVLEAIEKNIGKYDEDSQERALFVKLKGDLYRNISEIEVGQLALDAKKIAELCQEETEKILYKHLSPAHPTRLGLALSRSVWTYEIINNKTEAIQLAQKAYSEGLEHIDTLTSDSLYKDSIAILNLLQSNLTTWLTN